MEKSLARVHTTRSAVQKRNGEILMKEHSALDSKAVWANQVEQRHLNDSMAQLNLQHSFNKSYLKQRRMSSVGHLQKLQLHRQASQAGPTVDNVIHSRIQKRELREQLKRRERESAKSRRRNFTTSSTPAGASSPSAARLDELRMRREVDVMTPDNLRARATSRAGRERSAWELKQMVDVERIAKIELEKKRQEEREERNAQFEQYKKTERAKLDDKVSQFLKRVDSKPGAERKRRQSQAAIPGQVGIGSTRRISVVKSERMNSPMQKERRSSVTNRERRPSVVNQERQANAASSGRRQSQVLWQRRMSVVE